MKTFVCVVLALAVSVSCVEDDGQYHPELYGGDDGSYHHTADGTYIRGGFNNGKYASINAGFPARNSGFPAPAVSPFQAPAVSPFATQPFGFRNSNSALSPFASSVSANAQAVSAPAFSQFKTNSAANSRILRQDQELDLNSYHYLYQTENGINAEENGRIEGDNGGTKARGFYEYVGDDGVKYRVDYTADENGFQPTGAHLPQ